MHERDALVQPGQVHRVSNTHLFKHVGIGKVLNVDDDTTGGLTEALWQVRVSVLGHGLEGVEIRSFNRHDGRRPPGLFVAQPVLHIGVHGLLEALDVATIDHGLSGHVDHIVNANEIAAAILCGEDESAANREAVIVPVGL